MPMPKKPRRSCGNPECDKEAKQPVKGKYQGKYCSNRCQNRKKRLDHIAQFLAGELKDTQRRLMTNILKELRGRRCQLCNRAKWMGQPIPLEIDHADGNHNNNQPDNIRLICCNCAGLLPTFKGANKGNGRNYRKEIKDKGS